MPMTEPWILGSTSSLIKQRKLLDCYFLRLNLIFRFYEVEPSACLYRIPFPIESGTAPYKYIHYIVKTLICQQQFDLQYLSEWSIFGLIIKAAMAITLEIGVGNLLAELFAHTFVFFNHLHSARTITAPLLQPLFDSGDDFFIFVQSYHTIPQIIQSL